MIHNLMAAKIIIYSLLSLLITETAFNADRKYALKDIPPEVLNNASAVIRNNSIEFIVEDNGSAVKKVKYAVTVFNNEEKKHGYLVLPYDKTVSIEELEGTVYNAEGEAVAELEDIKDYSAYKGYNLYDDNRVKVAQLYYNSFPYTVEFTYEIGYDGFINWPEWFSRNSTDPVEYAEFKVVLPQDHELRYWCNRDSLKPLIQQIDDEKVYLWNWKNQLSLPLEATDNNLIDVADVILIAPGEFEISGSRGNMSTWKDFGSWSNTLWQGRRKLPDDALKAVNDIKAKTKEKKETISELYKYLQAKCRYVSVQLGIGGFQPFDAEYVNSRGYGDCKALSNYMVALLEAAGIEAYPALINSGELRLPLIEEFPSNQFNHVVVCVPGEKDTTWLECTSSECLPGQVGWSNENRKAMLITPGGGVLASTPKSSAEQNYMVKNINVALGTHKTFAKIKSSFGGNQLNYMSYIAIESPDEKEKWIKNLFEVPSIELSSYKFSEIDHENKVIHLDYEVAIQQYGSITGSRIFFNPNLIERVNNIPGKIEKRLSPIMIKYPYLDVDSIYYELPENYKVETIPDEVTISAPFGEYSNKILIEEGKKLLYTRTLKMKEYKIPAEKYEEYRKFYADIAKAERGKVVLIKEN